MSYVVKHRGDRGPVLADYTCPLHGVVEMSVDRDENGDAPDFAACSVPLVSVDRINGEVLLGARASVPCGERSTWTPSVIDSRVKQFEVVRGGWTKPERPTYYDTRDLGEGQDIDEWRAKRQAIRDEERKRHVMEMVKDA